MLENFFNETATLGATTKPGKAKKAKYQGQTVTDMRNDMVERAQATIDALEGYERGALRAPMARSVRNGIKVKIGYGKRNELLTQALAKMALRFTRDSKNNVYQFAAE